MTTCVFLHAHPDDEALLTAGTMAGLAAQGHRVVLVFATDGDAGLADRHALAGNTLDVVRRREALASARALGCARVEFLGYGDSGMAGTAPDSFCATPVEEAADRVAALLRVERADLVTSYDPVGGYGHPDHIQLHHVGALAARLAGTPRLLEATIDRDRLLRGLRLARTCGLLPTGFGPADFERSYTPSCEITHRIKIGRHVAAKRAAMAAHVSQAGGGDGVRTLAALLRLPRPLFGWVVGTEWYVRKDPKDPKDIGS